MPVKQETEMAWYIPLIIVMHCFVIYQQRRLGYQSVRIA